MTATSPLPTSSSTPQAPVRPAVEVDHLTHQYPFRKSARKGQPAVSQAELNRPALSDVSYSIAPGEIFGVLGPNGGGKTTMFRILSTMLQPTSGSVQIFGHDVRTQPDLVRRQLGVVFQMPSLDIKLTARENLTHQGHLYGLSGPLLSQRIDEALRWLDLHDRQHDYVEHYSGGMRRRVELAKAVLHRPRLLLLDEPSTGLDPGVRRDLWNQLLAMREQTGLTIAFTTHLMDEAEKCDRLAIICEGKLVAIDTPSNLKTRIGGDVITIEPEPDSANLVGYAEALTQAITSRFGPWEERNRPTLVDGKIRLERDKGAEFVATIAAAFAGRIRSITVGRPTLEDVFLNLTGKML